MSEVDRGPLNQWADGEMVPAHAEVILAWVRSYAESLVEAGSEFTAQERQQLLPGLESLIELVEDHLADVQQHVGSLREWISQDSGELCSQDQVRQSSRRRRLSGVDMEQGRARAEAQRMVQGELCEAVRLARQLGLPDRELAGLLRQVLASSDPGPASGDAPLGGLAQVVPLRPGPGRGSGPAMGT